MPLYSYAAKRTDGRNVRGDLEAMSEVEVIATLHQRNLTVLDIIEKKRAVERSLERRFTMRMPVFGSGVKHDEIWLFASQMAAMVESGLPLLRCLTSFGNEIENPMFKRVIDSVSIDVEEGSTFFDALSKHPKVFKIKPSRSWPVIWRGARTSAERSRQPSRIRSFSSGSLRLPSLF
jgi:type IV pilus assembly protein PilC